MKLWWLIQGEVLFSTSDSEGSNYQLTIDYDDDAVNLIIQSMDKARDYN